VAAVVVTAAVAAAVAVVAVVAAVAATAGNQPVVQEPAGDLFAGRIRSSRPHLGASGEHP
jgi:hypothetical protein